MVFLENSRDFFDDAIARTLDKLYDTGLKKLYSELALTSLTKQARNRFPM